eukprot:m.42330 g.42330  ORF g.42330 m.42330 type:complete len:172 (-) comp12871_c0_seq2:292-807(-)
MSVGGSDVLIAVLQTQLPQLQKAVGEAATLTVFAPNDGWHSLADLLEAEDWTIAQRLQCCQNVFAALNNLIQCRFYLQAFDASTIYSNAEGHVMLAIGSLQCLASPSSPVSTILARAHTVKSAESATVYQAAIFAASCLTQDGCVAVDEVPAQLFSGLALSGLLSRLKTRE